MGAKGTRETRVKVRDLEKVVQERGCTVVRQNATSHSIWRTPSGSQFVLPRDTKSKHVTQNVFATIRRTLLPDGVDLKEIFS